MKIIKHQKNSSKIGIIKRFLLLTLMGVLVFSPISSDLALRFFHLPMSMPEIFALPFCFFLWSDIRKIRIDKSLLAKLIALMLILIVFGIVYGEFSAFAIIGSARAYFWLFVFYCAFKSTRNPFTLIDIMYVSFGSILGWMISALLGLQSVIMLMLDFKISYGVLLAIPTFLSISFIKKNYLIMALGIAAIVVICTLSGVRRVIVISLLSVVLVSVLSVIHNPRKIFLVTVGVSLFTVTILSILPYVRNTAQNLSHNWYHRVFERSDVYIEGDVDNSDAGRLGAIIELAEDCWKYIVPPRGFVSRQTGSEKGAGDFNDLPLKELFWTFTLPGALIMIFHYYRRAFIHWRRYKRRKEEQSFVIVVYMIILFGLLFLEGTFLAYPYATPITGICLGLADKKIALS